MKCKKDYSRPSLEVIETKRTMLLAGSFNNNLEGSELIESYFDIL